MSYRHECLVTVIKPENVASSNNIQHIIKIVMCGSVCMCSLFVYVCLINNYECVHNPMFYIIKRKMCKFNIMS